MLSFEIRIIKYIKRGSAEVLKLRYFCSLGFYVTVARRVADVLAFKNKDYGRPRPLKWTKTSNSTVTLISSTNVNEPDRCIYMLCGYKNRFVSSSVLWKILLSISATLEFQILVYK